jgi:hypothetical protein
MRHFLALLIPSLQAIFLLFLPFLFYFFPYLYSTIHLCNLIPSYCNFSLNWTHMPPAGRQAGQLLFRFG